MDDIFAGFETRMTIVLVGIAIGIVGANAIMVSMAVLVLVALLP